MLGLERAYYEIDSARVRIIKLIAMERLSRDEGIPIVSKLMEAGNMANAILDKPKSDGSGATESEEGEG